METKIFQIPGCVTKITTMARNTIRLQIDSQETVSAEAMKRMFEMVNQLGWFTFNVHQIEAEDIIDLPPLKKIEKDDKTPAQRLRAVFYNMWKQNPGEFKDPDSHYIYMMERLIEHYKSKLD